MILFDADSLREIRKSRGLTQEQLEVATGIEQSTISRLERGEVRLPRINVVSKLAAALNVSIDELLINEPTKRGNRGSKKA